jgi:hypothetical protein
VQVDAFQAKKTLLENKVNLIKQLKLEQKGPVHMLDEISKALPDFVWLTALDETAGNVKFTGESNGLTAVAAFIEALQRSGWFPTIDLVSSKENNNIYTFNLGGSFKDPAVAALEREAPLAAPGRGPPPGAEKEVGRGTAWPTTASPSFLAVSSGSPCSPRSFAALGTSGTRRPSRGIPEKGQLEALRRDPGPGGHRQQAQEFQREVQLGAARREGSCRPKETPD